MTGPDNSDTPQIVIGRLASHHVRTVFDCGEEGLNECLRRFARQNDTSGTGRTYVAALPDDLRVLGFYTLSSGQLNASLLPKPPVRFPVPIVLLGRLAVDKTAQGKGLGELLLLHAFRRIANTAEIAGVHAVVVDALHDRAGQFYARYGFEPLQNDPLHLFLAVKKLLTLFATGT